MLSRRVSVRRTRSTLYRLVSDADQRVRHRLTAASENIVTDTLERAGIVDFPSFAGLPHDLIAEATLMGRCRTADAQKREAQEQHMLRCSAQLLPRHQVEDPCWPLKHPMCMFSPALAT